MNEHATIGLYIGCAVGILSCFAAIAWHYFENKNDDK